jgi:hypothetical protein
MIIADKAQAKFGSSDETGMGGSSPVSPLGGINKRIYG